MINLDILPSLNKEQAQIVSEIRLNKKIKSLIKQIKILVSKNEFTFSDGILNNTCWKHVDVNIMTKELDKDNKKIKNSLDELDTLYLKLKELRELDPKKIAKTNCYSSYRHYEAPLGSVPCWLDFNDEVFAVVGDEKSI